MSDCAFCRAYKTWAFTNEQNKPKGMCYEINVAIVIRSWMKGHKRNCGRVTDYRNQGIGYKLLYCPSCGAKMDEVQE